MVFLGEVYNCDFNRCSFKIFCICRADAAKDDKFGILSSSHCGLVELAAAVLYRVSTPDIQYAVLASHCGTCINFNIITTV